MQLAGRVAVVTGAAGGIGKEICARFGQEGMQVVAADLNADALDAAVEELRAQSLDVTGVTVDVTKRESVESLRDATLDAYGAVHVVCNNAGIANTAFGNVWEHENNDWRWSLEVHLFGVVNGCATFVPWMLDHGDEGWIVNTVSGNGGVAPIPDSAPYALAKASIVTYTECLFAQLRAAAGSRIGASLLFPSGYTPGLLNTGIWNEGVRPPEFARSTSRPLRRGLDAFVERMRDSGQEVQFTPLEEVADQVATGILEDRFWMLAPSERTDRQIRTRAESMIQRAQPDYMLPVNRKKSPMVSWFRQFCIHVSDIEATIKFYEMLGLECTSRTKITDDIDEAVIENPERGAWIQLAQNKTITPPIDMGTAMWKLYVYTDDCQGVYDRAIAAGYKSVTPPVASDRWPVTIAFIEDPDGYQVELVQRDEVPAERNAGGTPRDQSLAG